MTTILPSERSPLDAIMSQLGHGLSQTLPQAAMQRSQREMGISAIDQLERDLALSGGDITKMLPSIAKAYTLNPNLERSGLGQEFLKNAAAGKYPWALEDASKGTNTQSTPPPQNQQQPNHSLIDPIAAQTQQSEPPILEGAASKKNALDINAAANQLLGEIRPDLVNPATQYGAINTFDSELKQDLSPEEESRMRQQLMDKHKNMNVVNQVIDRVREGVKNKYNEAKAKYGFDQDRLNQIQKKWGDFTTGSAARLEPHLNKFGEKRPRTKEVLQNKYNQYASAFPVNMTPEQMHTNAMALLQNDINKMDALEALPSMPPFRNKEDVAAYIDKYKDAYKDLADQGFLEALKEDAFINKDMGNEEFHSLIWGDQTNKNLLNQIHSYKAPKEYEKVGPIGAQTNKYNHNYEREHQKYIGEISNSLKKLKPEDDLILARAMVLDNDGTVEDFIKALRRAQEEGLKLSEFQKTQLQEINIPREPPLYEFFREENFTKPALKAWAPWLNYMRGKK